MSLLSFVLMVSLGAAQAGSIPNQDKPQLVRVARLLGSGRYAQAIHQARRALSLDSGAAGMQAILGIGLARTGDTSEALRYLEQSAGTMAYVELGGLAAHADVLRSHGLGHQAWSIRRQRLSDSLSDRQIVQTLVQGVDDHLVAGDLSGALDLGEQAVAQDPESPAAHAFLATALLAMGDVDGAEYHHWLSRRGLRRRLARVAVNQALLAERAGDLIGALNSWERLEVMRRHDPGLAAWHAAWMRRQGWVEMAKARVLSVDSRDPELLAERVRILLELSEAEDASRELMMLERLFPSHPAVQELNRRLR